MKEAPDKEDPDFKNKKLEKELKKRESTIESLKEQINNNHSILQDVISEKNQLKRRIQEYDLNLIDTKLNQYQKLQEDHQKLAHRLQVTKKHLDTANANVEMMQKEIESLLQIVEDLKNRGVFDYIRGKYPESYQEYKSRE